MDGCPDSLCLILTNSVFIPPHPTGIWLAGLYSHDVGLVCRWQIGNRRKDMHESKRGDFFFSISGSSHTRLVIVRRCLVNARPWVAWLENSAGERRLPSPSSLPCNLAVQPEMPGEGTPGLHNPSASRGQRRRQPIVPHQIPSWAAVKRLLWKVQKRLPVSITWRKRLGHNEVHCGCDWHWICYLCITTYIESSLTLRPSFKGHSSAAE